MTRLNNLKNKVKLILKDVYEARDDDKLLYYYICKSIGLEYGINVDKYSFKDVMLNKDLDLPNMESVRRVRQKLQEESKEYWGDKRYERMKAQEEYIEFALNDKECLGD